MKIKYEGKQFDVELTDDGSLDTVILVNRREYRYSQEMASEFRNKRTGELTEKGLRELALDAIDTDPFFWDEPVSPSRI